MNWISSLATKTVDDLLAEYRQNNPDGPHELVRGQAAAKKQRDPTLATVMVPKRHSPGAPWHSTIAPLGCPPLPLTADPARGAIVTPALVAEVRRLNPRVQVASVHNFPRSPAALLEGPARGIGRSPAPKAVPPAAPPPQPRFGGPGRFRFRR